MKTNSTIFDIPFPDTTTLERQVLADVVTTREVFGDVNMIIHPDFFTTTARKQIWLAVCDLYNKGKDFDLASIFQVIGEPVTTEVAPMLINVGGADTTMQHAAHLRNGAAKRRAYLAASTFLQNAISPEKTEQDILASVEMFTRSVEGPAPLDNEQALPVILQRVRENVVETAAAREQGKTIRITTGFRYWDIVFYGGLKPGQLVILAARPSVGKTAVMLQMAKSAAMEGNPVELFSLEMTADELAERLLFSTGKVRPFQISQGGVDWDEYNKAEKMLSPLPIYVNDFSRTLDDIVTRMAQAVKQGRCKISFIDYLGLIQDAIAGGNVKLYQAIARITGTLKAVAKRLHIPVVLLCQLNRDQAREGRAPELYDLRDSGSIEQDADIVLMLESQMKEGRIIAHLRKNRGGKKEYPFVLKPNDTYSEFTEEEPLEPDADKIIHIETDKPEEIARKPFFNEMAEADDDPTDELPF